MSNSMDSAKPSPETLRPSLTWGYLWNSGVVRFVLAAVVILFAYSILSLYFINVHTSQLFAMRIAEAARIAQLGAASLEPFRDDVLDGRLEIETAVLVLGTTQIDRLNQIQSQSPNLFFLMLDDGTLLVDPFAAPSTDEPHNVSNFVDPDGRFIFREFLQAAANSTHEGYVYHRALRPGGKDLEPVLSYVVAIPEINVVVGTRSYLIDLQNESRNYVISSITLALILVLLMFFIIRAVVWPVLKGYGVLLHLFDQVTDKPDVMPDVPVNNFRMGTESWRMLDGFHMMMQRMQATTRLLRQSQRLLEERVDERTRELQVRYQESERRREVAEGLRDVLDTLNSESSMEDTLDYILQQCIRLLGPSAAAVFELTPAGKDLRLRASRGLPKFLAPSVRTIPLENNPFEPVIRQREAKVVPVSSQTEWAGMEMGAKFACALIVPVQLRELPHGVLVLYYRQEQKHSEEDFALALALADQAALAIENGSLRARERQVAAATERSRLARELHDSVSQALFGIALGARTIHTLLPTSSDPKVLKAPLDYILQLAEGGIAEMRSLIFELRPESLESEGIVAGLKKHAAALQSRYNINVVTDLDEEPRLPIDLKESLYRVGVEAMHNIVKHAKATQIDLSMHLSESQVTLQIKDNGIGFQPNQQFPGHLGLQSMRERTEQFKGVLTIESALGGGTTIRVIVPWPMALPSVRHALLTGISNES